MHISCTVPLHIQQKYQPKTLKTTLYNYTTTQNNRHMNRAWLKSFTFHHMLFVFQYQILQWLFFEFLFLLFRCGADTMLQNKAGDSAYDLAVKSGNENIIEKFTSHLGQGLLEKFTKLKTDSQSSSHDNHQPTVTELWSQPTSQTLFLSTLHCGRRKVTTSTT